MTLTTPARILVVGGGGREHALAWKVAGEPGVAEVAVLPGSAAIAAEPRVRALTGDPLDPAVVVAAARAFRPDLVVVGPEAPLAAGAADALMEAGFAVFGPTRAAARLESSKAFCHEIAVAASVRMARARAFAGGEEDAAAAFAGELDAAGRGIVLKADGLAAGKGVIVTDSLEQALELVPSFLVGRSPDEPALVIEERLAGREASVIAVCDGTAAQALPAARDHKRLCDDDRGPNTGGMGAYSPVPELDDDAVADVIASIHQPLLDELSRRGMPFRGFLYAGLMLTDDGPVLLECNVRLGDPEAQAMLPLLAEPLAPILMAAAEGRLDPGPGRVAVMPGAAVVIVLAAKGYPGTPRRGDPIEGIDEALAGGALIFHGGTVRRPQGGYGTNGGRVLTVVGRGPTLAEARAAAEVAADRISWDGMQRRRDIGADLVGATR